MRSGSPIVTGFDSRTNAFKNPRNENDTMKLGSKNLVFSLDAFPVCKPIIIPVMNFGYYFVRNRSPIL